MTMGMMLGTIMAAWFKFFTNSVFLLNQNHLKVELAKCLSSGMSLKNCLFSSSDGHWPAPCACLSSCSHPVMGIGLHHVLAFLLALNQ